MRISLLTEIRSNPRPAKDVSCIKQECEGSAHVQKLCEETLYHLKCQRRVPGSLSNEDMYKNFADTHSRDTVCYRELQSCRLFPKKCRLHNCPTDDIFFPPRRDLDCKGLSPSRCRCKTSCMEDEGKCQQKGQRQAESKSRTVTEGHLLIYSLHLLNYSI